MKDYLVVIDGRIINLANVLYTSGDKDHSYIVFNTPNSTNPLARLNMLDMFMPLDKLNQLIMDKVSPSKAST